MEALVNVFFCDCGWLMSESNNKIYCDNPKCPERTKLFQVRIYVEEVKEAADVYSNNGNSRECKARSN